MYDLIIKNATIIDGTGEPSFVADVGVARGKIVDIAPNLRVSSREVVEAEGLVLAPGFIDVQNHSDSYWCLFDGPGLESSVLQGFTSILVGQCGTSLAPLLSRNALKSSQKWHDLNGNNFNWTSFGEFAAHLGTQKFGANVGSLVGYSTIRRGLLGDEHRAITSEEGEILLQAVRQSLTEGAFGVSTGLAYAHESNVSELELYDVAQAVADSGGVLSLHLRNEADGLPESVAEGIEIAQKAGARLKLSHFKVRGQNNWTLLPEILESLEDAVHRGSDISFDVYPYESTWQPLYTYLPKWATQGGRAEMLRHLTDPTQYKKILSYLHEHHSIISDLIVASTSYQMRVVSKTFAEIAQRLDMSSEEALLEVVKNGGTEVLVFDHSLNPRQVDELLTHPLSIVATDGGSFPETHAGTHISKLVHPRCFGTSANFLSRVRHTKSITLENAIAKLTSLPARVWGLQDRGQITVGYAADMVLFSPTHIIDRATTDNPYRGPAGIQAVWVNGVLAAADGKPTTQLAGHFLRKM
jgi:N-acyl-D-amino-acid deacylase